MSLGTILGITATVSTLVFTLTLIWAGRRFGNSKYGKDWSKFAFWQASLTLALILLNAQLAISGPDGVYALTRPYVYIYMTIVSLISTYYSLKMATKEKLWTL